MMWGRFLAPAVAIFLAMPVDAGPWAQDPGEVFLSYSLSAASTRDAVSAGSVDPDMYHSLYAEIGLGRRLTLGLDTGFDEVSRFAVGFLRYTLTPAADPFQMAADIGVGFSDRPGDGNIPIYRIGGSIGLGFGSGAVDWVPVFDPEGGWLVLDASILSNPDEDWTVWQVEGTAGVNITDRFAGMLQVKAEEWPGAEMAVTLSPSMLWRLEGQTTLQMGARIGLQGSDEVGLRLGLWRDF